MRPLKDRVSITIDHDLVVDVKDLAEEDDRNFSQYINLILREWVKTHPKKSEKKSER